ncbi:flagellar basal body-associated FliL family protein [Halocynthiibacter namhaensis]|uniref:flagellar basal body-associated FliL family protein n=1 Tax=Halocynthiibacter namhaensis TaxID=1290553 RepID=UPI000AC6F99D
MGKILPILLALVGIGVGVGAGVALRPPPPPPVEVHPCGPGDDANLTADMPNGTADEMHEDGEEPPETSEFVKLANQFVVSVVKDEKIVALVVMSLSVEVLPGNTEEVFRQLPKLRDSFLQVMFDHANIGGFDGAFTESNKMTLLRNALLETARRQLGPPVIDVLIQDLIRQDL